MTTRGAARPPSSSGSRGALYEYAGIDPASIVNAAMLALDLAEDAGR